jgi:hypothetical protein
MKSKLIWSIFWALVVVFIIAVFFLFSPLPAVSVLFLSPFAVLFLLGAALIVLTVREKVAGKLRAFFLLSGTAAAGIFVFILLHNLMSGWIGIEEFFSLVMAVFVCPLAFLVGAIGSIVLFVKQPWPVREMRAVRIARNFMLLGVIIIAVEVLVRMLIDLGAVGDVALIVGITCIIAGIAGVFIVIFKKKW